MLFKSSAPKDMHSTDPNSKRSLDDSNGDEQDMYRWMSSTQRLTMMLGAEHEHTMEVSMRIGRDSAYDMNKQKAGILAVSEKLSPLRTDRTLLHVELQRERHHVGDE